MIVHKTVENEVEIDLTSEDIKMILNESGDNRGLLGSLNNIAQFLKAVPDRLIAGMADSHRETAATLLREAARRFQKGDDE